MPVCELPFYPNLSNYKSEHEHDANERKIWFLVLDGDGGLFTKKQDALAFVDGDEDALNLFLKRKQAVECWTTHCLKSHDQTDVVHQDKPPEPAASTLRCATPAATPRSAPTAARTSPIRTTSPGPLRVEEAPRRRKSTPVPLFMDDDEPDPWTLRRATPAPAPPAPGPTPTSPGRAKTSAAARRVDAPRKETPVPLFMDDDEPDPWMLPAPAPPAPGPAPTSPGRAKTSAAARRVDAPRKDGKGDGAPTPWRQRWDDAPAVVIKRPKAGQASRAPGVPKTLAASERARTVSTSVSVSTPTSISVAGSASTSTSIPAARARTAGSAFPPRTPVPPSTASSTSASAARARTAAPAFPPRTPVRGSTCSSASASPRRALSTVPPHGARAEPPPIYAVESGSESDSPSPAPVAPTPLGAGASPSVSSISSPSSLGASGASEGFPSRPSSPSPFPSRAGLVSPCAGISSASSASRAGFASPVFRAGTRPMSASRSAEAQPLLLYNTGSRTFYKNPSMAVREMTEEESVEVVDCEDVGEFLSARAGRRAGESA
ncbi:hypothetical protein B0H11DRAFT_2263544 [Mycena galericulata]|nr:hypothetical protein B0H11DRAFT_2263544 [Mycena galericulata]